MKLKCIFIILIIFTLFIPVNATDMRIEKAQDEIRTKEVGKYGMLPIYAQDIENGTYEIEVESSSPYFRIISSELTVNDNEMIAKITIPSLSYSYVFMGTAADAEKSEKHIGYEEDNGHSVFNIPVKALDCPIDCAAFSVKRKIWYDRKLVFYASSLPQDKLKITLPDYDVIEEAVKNYKSENVKVSDNKTAEAMDIDLPDGEYSIEVNMTGGSGRASISSPSLLTVRGGKAYARLLWSSTYYDYMIVGGERFENLTTDGGNSTFEIPVTVMDEGMSVIADTTAMGDPVEINYMLTFYRDTVGNKGEIPQEAAKKVLIIGLVIIVLGWVINYFLKKGRK